MKTSVCLSCDRTGIVNSRVGVQDERDDEPVKTKNFGENEDKDHPDKQPRLLGRTPDTRITDDTDGKAGGETGETDRETGAELDKAGVEGHGGGEVTGNEDRDDETVDTDDTSHNDRDGTLHHEVWPEDGHGGDSDARLGGAVGCADTGEYDGGGAAHGAEEGPNQYKLLLLLLLLTIFYTHTPW